MRAVVAALALAASMGCNGSAVAQAPPVPCSDTQKSWIVAELLFGQTHVTGGAWRRFLAAEVTPRFPDGFTVYDARGQWRPPGGTAIIRERTKVVMIAIPPGPDGDARLQQIIRAYKDRFRQQSVGLIVRPACVSF